MEHLWLVFSLRTHTWYERNKQYSRLEIASLWEHITPLQIANAHLTLTKSSLWLMRLWRWGWNRKWLKFLLPWLVILNMDNDLWSAAWFDHYYSWWLKTFSTKLTSFRGLDLSWNHAENSQNQSNSGTLTQSVKHPCLQSLKAFTQRLAFEAVELIGSLARKVFHLQVTAQCLHIMCIQPHYKDIHSANGYCCWNKWSTNIFVSLK